MNLYQMLTAEKLYLNPDVTAIVMAKRLGCMPRHISAAVSVATGGNFSQLVNRLRLDKAVIMLKAARYSHLTVEDIGLQCGYRSRQAFYQAFARYVGGTPNQLRKQAE